MRKFKRVEIKQFMADLEKKDLLAEYEDIKLPKRATSYSAGYDIYSPVSFTLKKGESINIPTGIKAYMEKDEVFIINSRSGHGFKNGIRLVNIQGWVDADYVDNDDNEGHIHIGLTNNGEKEFILEKGKAIAQGMFIKYLTVDDEDLPLETRQGGFGSTEK